MIARRSLEESARRLFAKYPVLTITGPRQSGKTTLCRTAFPELAYVSLESPDQREFAVGDPRGFLRRLPEGAILDEIQRAPELVSYIQEIVDDSRRNSAFVLTGSQEFRVSEAIGQSLAGRTGILRLLPFSIGEADQLRPAIDTDDMMYTGFYPRIYDQDLNPTQALGDYFETYVEAGCEADQRYSKPLRLSHVREVVCRPGRAAAEREQPGQRYRGVPHHGTRMAECAGSQLPRLCAPPASCQHLQATDQVPEAVLR